MSAIVLDGHLKSALASVRSLGKAGIAVACGAERATAMACHSRHAKSRFVYASPKKDQKQFTAEIIAQAQKLFLTDGQKPVLYCFSDATSLCIARAYKELREFILIPLPALEAMETASDKGATYAQAQKLSIPTIRTFAEEDFEAVVFPAVVKNRHSIVWKNGNAVSGSASFVFSKEELLKLYKTIKEDTEEAPLVQEFIKGEEFGIEMLCEKGEVILQFAHKRIRSLSPRGGAAVVKETASETETVKLMGEYSHALVRELAWTGPVMVEFKVDARDGKVLLMEINGRFWGSLPLAVLAGANFPYAYYELAQDRAIQSEAFQPKHIRSRHFLGDVKWLSSVFFASDPLRSELYPSRAKALFDFKKEFFLSRGDIFAWDDLKPSLTEYIDILTK